MTSTLSPDTQAILLLTAPFIVARASSSPDLLTPGEYKRLARKLHEMERRPADLLSSDATHLLRACRPLFDETRLQRLLERGFLLSRAVERWQARALWVVSRADAEYPRRLKSRLRDDAPAVLYGCGDIGLLETGGLAVVGSRHVDDSLIEYTTSVGRLAARAGRTLVSGGAKGIDQAAMHGALDAGGRACGVLADSLERTAMNREHRDLLLDGRLVLVSPYDPGAGFNVGNAMQRNKLIYACADAALVVSADLKKGGTWQGALEQLNKFRFVPLYVRSPHEASAALDALHEKGALLWPNPHDPETFASVFDAPAAPDTVAAPQGLPLFPLDGQNGSTPTAPAVDDRPGDEDAEAPRSLHQKPEAPAETNRAARPIETTPAEEVFAAVRDAMRHLLQAPLNDAQVAEALDVSNAQARAWLQRLVEEGTLEKLKKPIRYVHRSQLLPLGEETRGNRSRRTRRRALPVSAHRTNDGIEPMTVPFNPGDPT